MGTALTTLTKEKHSFLGNGHAGLTPITFVSPGGYGALGLGESERLFQAYYLSEEVTGQFQGDISNLAVGQLLNPRCITKHEMQRIFGPERRLN